MKKYSIIRVGNEYVVQADDKSILKTTSKRKAARCHFRGDGAAGLAAVPAIVGGRRRRIINHL